MVPWRLAKCDECEGWIRPRELKVDLWSDWWGRAHFTRAIGSLSLVAPYVGPKIGRTLCAGCAADGKATFVCTACEEHRVVDKIEKSFGDPPEYLCKPCYASVPAKEWDEEVERLESEHRYDFR